MDINMLLVLIICYILANCFEARNISNEEDLVIEKQLRIINKVGISTIKTKFGDIYDCVDFYKQPAFDHPRLKNHTFYPQMKYKYQKKHNNVSSINGYTILKSFKDGGCPSGSVPIRRITKADLIREKEYPSRFGSLDGKQPDVAVVQTETGYGPFAGAGMIAGLYRPTVKSGPSYSAVRLRIQNGDDAIQIGWRIDPALYGDDQVRFYVYFKAGQTQCFNTKCSGFVHVHRRYSLDHVFMEHNTGQTKFLNEIQLSLERDTATGNWWVLLGPDLIQIGFWPAKIFSGLNSVATYVDWGGEVLSIDGDVEMGLGRKPQSDVLSTAYCRVIIVLTPDGKTINPTMTRSTMTNLDKYEVLNINYRDNYFRHLLFYGGPNQ